MQSVYSGEPCRLQLNASETAVLGVRAEISYVSSVSSTSNRRPVLNLLTEKKGGKSQPEFRLPPSNVGSAFIPVGSFRFAWTVE